MEKEPEEYYYGVVILWIVFFYSKPTCILILIPFILSAFPLEVLPQGLLIRCLGLSGWSLVLDDTDMCLFFCSQGALDWGPDLHFSGSLNCLRLGRT